jgi:hypothetical protein
MLLSKNQILEVDDIRYEDVFVPQWDGTVRVKVMTGTERDSYETSLYEFKPGSGNKQGQLKLNRDDMRAKLLARVIVDEKNQRLFCDADIRALGAKSADALDVLFEVAQRLNGLAKGDLEKAEKNSESEA